MAEAASKKARLNTDALARLLADSRLRSVALSICTNEPNARVFISSLFKQARLLLRPDSKLFQDSDELRLAMGSWTLAQSDWNPREGGILGEFIEYASRIVGLNKERDVRWCVAIALCMFLRVDEITARKILFGMESGLWYIQPTKIFETKRALLKSGEAKSSTELSVDSSDEIVNVHGVEMLRGSHPPSMIKTINPKFHPASAKSNLKSLVEATVISANHVPILLKGGSGSGKTWTIRTLAQMCGRPLVELQLDDQIDSKTLLGSMASIKGSFTWVPGALTQAIHSGSWVLVEDIDCCPPEILSSLKPLFETGRISLPNRSIHFDLECHPSFRLFATTNKQDYSLSRNCEEISIQELSPQEIEDVCVQKYDGRIPEHVILAIVRALQDVSQAETRSLDASCFQPMRDLFKWLDRVAEFCALGGTNNTPAVSTFLTEKVKRDIVFEGVEVLTSRLPSLTDRTDLARAIALRWELDPESGSAITMSRRPEFRFDSTRASWRAGRVEIQFSNSGVSRDFHETFAPTSVALRTLEQIACCVKLNEPCLLVGETGAGKTSMVQLLAQCCGKRLIVQNMHVQSDSTEFLGGFKPAPSHRIEAGAIHTEFLRLFSSNFSVTDNEKFLNAILGFMEASNWKKFCKSIETACAKHWSREAKEIDQQKRVKGVDDNAWRDLADRVEAFKIKSQNKDLFHFVEGALIRALRNGDWILLDEVNLAAGETLERLLPLLEDAKSSLRLTERGDVDEIPRHKEFRLFAAMNPSTDFGKKNLPSALRSRFTEIYVDEVSDAADVRLVVDRFLGQDARDLVEPVVATFMRARELSASLLMDSNGHAPRYSLRTLVRTLHGARALTTSQRFGMKRALVESFQALFTTALEPKSCATLVQEISMRLLSPGEKLPKTNTSKAPGANKILVCNDEFWLDRGTVEIEPDEKFIMTPHVESKLKLVGRAVALKRYPILLQGPTSAGKTSLIAHLARTTGNKVVRINNHEHTDLEEYLGSYSADEEGKLVFHEGALVEAVRNGHWVILDELNLAPSDVLEALNRLLDDNRELFLTETQETITPHPHFILFATQNPPGGAYGGRKQLSKAFRNRFLEIHVDDIPVQELETILERRNKLPSSFTKAMVGTMKELQLLRSKSQLFAGKAGFITPRDLMRWADRDPRSYLELAQEGYRLLGERLRSEEERMEVKAVIERFCRSKIDLNEMYSMPAEESSRAGLVWTTSMRRLFSLVHACALKKEPCLIVGETGLGKTMCVQSVARTFSTNVVVLNCHQHTETADIIGSLRPVRFRGDVSAKIREILAAYKVESVEELLESKDERIEEETKRTVRQMLAQSNKLFEWMDGPLVSCMRSGDFFLLDEISLAEDAVLERLNSVFETGRTLTLAERGGKVVEVITANDGFRAFATMNPGGDFGKRELSPALRNRFTEIWLPPITDWKDFSLVAENVLKGLENSRAVAEEMIAFVRWFNELSGKMNFSLSPPLSMRDVIAWADFIKTTCATFRQRNGSQDFAKIESEMLAHGCFLTCLDGLGVGAGSGTPSAKRELLQQCSNAFPKFFEQEQAALSGTLIDTPKEFGVGSFLIDKVASSGSDSVFDFDAPTTRLNLVRLLRAMQLPRAILLEGSPGVGKTSIVSALARKIGKKLVRINLSEQTDFSDLIGSDLPVPNTEGSNGEKGKSKMDFQWSDGVFLKALVNGDWVLLDEMNLASQSVLEGLNAVLDHRATVFVPELNRSFPCHPNFRVFACQNPLQQGGGRKGLPRSFLNRFTKVYVEALDERDFLSIARSVFPGVDHLDKIIRLTKRMQETAQGQGEYNLRDAFRFCELFQVLGNPRVVFDVLYASRFGLDPAACEQVLEEIFSNEETTKMDVFDWHRVEFANDKTLVLGNQRCLLERPSGPFLASKESIGTALCSFPSSLMPILVRTGICIANNYPVLLVGESGSGKSLVLNKLSALAGKELTVFQMTSGTDATELLGCFEQSEPSQRAMDLLNELELNLKSELESSLSSTNSINFERMAEVERIRFEIHQASQKILASSAHFPFDEADQCVKLALNVLPSNDACSRLREAWVRFRLNGDKEKGFQWVDGALIRAVEQGEWIVLEDANLCSPTVLDRLNSLLEIGGELVVNEQGTILGGGLRVCRPHKDFRIFLTLDPTKGLVSRAMRNRCVEIYLDPRRYSPSVRDRVVLLEEDLGVKPEAIIQLGAKDQQQLVERAKRERSRAELGMRPLKEVWLDELVQLPRPVAWQVDLTRDLFVSKVRFAFRCLTIFSTDWKEDLISTLCGTEVEKDLPMELQQKLLMSEADVSCNVSLSSYLIPILKRLDQQECRDWLDHVLNRYIPTSQLFDAFEKGLLSEKRTSIGMRRSLESLLPSNKTDSISAARLLTQMFDALDAWIEAVLIPITQQQFVMEELLDYRDSFWRMFLSPCAKPTGNALSVLSKRLFKSVQRAFAIVCSIDASFNKHQTWIHFENVAKRFDSTLKKPCFVKIFSIGESDQKETMKKQSSSLLKLESRPRPPTDLIAVQGMQKIAELCDEEFSADRQSVAAVGGQEIISTASTIVKKRGEQWRRRGVSALATLRFVGGGGGGRADRLLEQSSSTNLSQLRDAAIQAIVMDGKNDELEEELFGPHALPLAERVVALLDLAICERVCRLIHHLSQYQEESTQEEVEEIRLLTKRMLDVSLKTNCISASSLAPYQELLWALDATSTNNINPHHLDALLPELLVSAGQLRFGGVSKRFPDMDDQGYGSSKDFIKSESIIWQNSVSAFTASLVRGSGLGVDHSVSKPDQSIHVKRSVSLTDREAKRAELLRAQLSLESFGNSSTSADLSMVQIMMEATSKKLESVSQTMPTNLKCAWEDAKKRISSLSEHGDYRAIGKCWATLGLVRYWNLALDSAVDPQSKPRILAEMLMIRKRMLERDLSALKLDRFWGVGSNQPTSEMIELSNRLKQLESEIAELVKSGLAIEREAEFDKMAAEIRMFTQTIGAIDRVLHLINSLDAHRPDADYQTFLNVCADFCMHIARSFPACVDMTYGFVAAVYQCMHGIQMMSLGLSSARASSRNEMDTLKSSFAWPRVSNDRLGDLTSRLGPKFNTKLLLAALPSVELNMEESTNHLLSDQVHEKLRSAFEAMTVQWREDRREAERRRAEKEATVRLKSSKKKEEEQEVPLVDLKEEAEFKKMFPDFHTEFAAKPANEDDEMEDRASMAENDVRGELSSQTDPMLDIDDSFQALNADQVEALANSFLSLYGEKKNQLGGGREALRRRAFEATYDLASDAVSKLALFGSSDVDSALLASNLFVVKSALSDLDF